MTLLKLRAACSPTDGYDLAEPDAAPVHQLYPVLVLVERSQPPGAPHVVGQHVMTESDAAMLKAGVDLWNQIPALADQVRFEWDGWTPAPTNLPLGKIGRVLGMFGIRVNQVDAPPPAIGGPR